MQIDPSYNWSKQKVRAEASPDAILNAAMLTESDIRLPPPFRLVVLREVGDAFAHAKAHAAEDGAGTLVFVGRFDLAEFAVVLEPDEPMRNARRSFYACMAALAETLTAHAPPETDIRIDWPDSISINRGLVGGGRMAWPENADEDAPPDWLVFGATIRLVSMSGTDAGLHPLSAALEDEGFSEFGAERLMEIVRTASDGDARCLAGAGLRRGRKELSAASCAGRRERDAPRHRRQWRSSAAAHGADAGRTQGAHSRAGDALMARSADARAATVKLLKTIRLDPSDTFVFEGAAEPGEWAVTGTFAFAEADPETLQGKARTAFRAGFLGVSSLGWSTLVQIVETDEAGRAAAVEQLAQRLIEHYGAPDMDAARAAANEEFDLCAIALQPRAGYAHCASPHIGEWRNPRSLPHAEGPRRPQGLSRIFVHRGRR